MAFKFKVEFDRKAFEKNLMKCFEIGSAAQELWSSIVFYGSTPYMPMITGQFIDLSIAASTELFKYGELLYPTVYAHFLWQGIVFVDPETGSAWARAGVTKIPIGRELIFNKESNPLATAQWVIAAQNDNLEKWINDFQKAINAGIV